MLLRTATLAALAVLAACTTAPPVQIETVAPTPPPPPPPPGMELVLQQPVETAVALLGRPRLDKLEGVSRQLQFAGACVLDVWYYPTASGGMVATYADARFADGRDVAAGQCFRILLPPGAVKSVTGDAPPAVSAAAN